MLLFLLRQSLKVVVLLQASGLVPIVEPEVLLDGEHGIDRTLEVAEAIWAETFKYLADNKVLFEGILLKPSMVSNNPIGTRQNPGSCSRISASHDLQRLLLVNFRV